MCLINKGKDIDSAVLPHPLCRRYIIASKGVECRHVSAEQHPHIGAASLMLIILGAKLQEVLGLFMAPCLCLPGVAFRPVGGKFPEAQTKE